MSIWHREISLEEIKQYEKGTMVEYLGIEVIELGDNFVKATMPVDYRTHQPMGILHGGASVVLAETAASLGAQLVAGKEFRCVGLDINANHIRAVKSGIVTATATPFHLGKSTQVWQIKIENENNQLICISRLTVSVLKIPSQE